MSIYIYIDTYITLKISYSLNTENNFSIHEYYITSYAIRSSFRNPIFSFSFLPILMTKPRYFCTRQPLSFFIFDKILFLLTSFDFMLFFYRIASNILPLHCLSDHDSPQMSLLNICDCHAFWETYM